MGDAARYVRIDLEYQDSGMIGWCQEAVPYRTVTDSKSLASRSLRWPIKSRAAAVSRGVSELIAKILTKSVGPRKFTPSEQISEVAERLNWQSGLVSEIDSVSSYYS